MTGLEWIALGIFAIVIIALSVIYGVSRMVARAYAEADARSEAIAARSASKRKARADEIEKRPLPTKEEMDAWDRLE